MASTSKHMLAIFAYCYFCGECKREAINSAVQKCHILGIFLEKLFLNLDIEVLRLKKKVTIHSNIAIMKTYYWLHFPTLI